MLREDALSRIGMERDEKKCARAGDEDRYEEEITLVSGVHRTAISNKIGQQQQRTFVEVTRRRGSPVDRLVGSSVSSFKVMLALDASPMLHRLPGRCHGRLWRVEIEDRTQRIAWRAICPGSADVWFNDRALWRRLAIAWFIVRYNRHGRSMRRKLKIGRKKRRIDNINNAEIRKCKRRKIYWDYQSLWEIQFWHCILTA